MTPIPTAHDLLSGTASLKPLHYDADALSQLLEAFRDIPVSEASAEKMASLSHQLAGAEWAAAHNAAKNALMEALEMARMAGARLATDADSLESICRAQLPNASSLKAIRDPQLQAKLAPLKNYLEQWNKSLRPWMELTSRRLNAEPKITWADYRRANPITTPVAPPATAAAHVHGPECNHGPHEPHAPAQPHVHGPGCGHHHHHEPHAPAQPHAHGPGCGHAHHPMPGEACEHHHGPKGFAAALPRGKAARWAFVSAGMAALGAAFINFLGKKDGDREKDAEKAKTDAQRAGDIAYTINHAVSCGTTDVVLQPVIAAAFGINVGCNHPDHHHPAQQLTLRSFAHEAGHYFKGEIFGDFVAVPLTIGIQRFFPNFMHGVRRLIEPLTGWAFRLGAEHAAKQWGKQHGLAADSPEVAARANAMYEHEVRHLPQAVVWNMFAYPIGAFGQKAMGHGRAYPEIFKSKLVGAAVSNGLLIGGRMLAPGAAQRWDRFAGNTIVLPVSKVAGKAFGLDEKTIKEAHAHASWEDRIATQDASPTPNSPSPR